VVDSPKLDQMLGNLKRYCGELTELAAMPREQFLADKHRIGSAKYHFVIAIECCIDVANHVISAENFRFPKDNADSFVVLVEQGVLPQEMLATYRAMARFRNRLVHQYWAVDDELVYSYLADNLRDFECFAKAVASFVSRQADGPPE
jgi:uncharacterized protein YutE (UPF0331/DUF86 family)